MSATASPQSQVIDRDALEARLRAVEAQYAGTDPPLPEFWGGYVVAVDTLELWQGQADRLHERVRYRRQGANFVREPLAP